MNRALLNTLEGGAVPGESVRIFRDEEARNYVAVICYPGAGGQPLASHIEYRAATWLEAMLVGRQMIGHAELTS